MSTRAQIEFYEDSAAEFGQPSARIYQHCDGYPTNEPFTPLGRLKTLYKLCKKGFGMYGQRITDPEWSAAEYVSQFRKPGEGVIYVTQELHGDIEYLYRVVCGARWKVHVFEPEYNATYDITGFKEVQCVTI